MFGISNSQQHALSREKVLIDLYKKAFPAVAKYISRRAGSLEEAKDVFHDALVIYYENTAAVAIKNDTAWLVGTAKNLWLKKYRQNTRFIPLDNIDITLTENDGSPSAHRLLHFLATAGKKCMDLLTGFYYDKLPLTAIADQFGYSGVRSATVQKYKCLEKVRETIKEKALAYEDFMD